MVGDCEYEPILATINMVAQEYLGYRELYPPYKRVSDSRLPNSVDLEISWK